MTYGYATLEDKTNVLYSPVKENGTVELTFERCAGNEIKIVRCILPYFKWKKNKGFSEEELARYDEYVRLYARDIYQKAVMAKPGNVSCKMGITMVVLAFANYALQVANYINKPSAFYLWLSGCWLLSGVCYSITLYSKRKNLCALQNL